MIKQYPTSKKRMTVFALVFALLLSMVPASTSFAAKKVSLSKKKLTIQVGKSKKLKLKNNKKKAKWKIVSGKDKIKLRAKKKTGVTIAARKKGKAVVQVKVGKKRYTCKVTVTGKSGSGSGDDGTSDGSGSADPSATADATASGQPSGTANPNGSGGNGGSSGGNSGTGGGSGSGGNDGSDQPLQDPTQNAGENIELGEKTAFTIGSRQLALGLSKDEVKKVLGNVTREGKSPQGFDVIVYNPGNTYIDYTLVYLKDDAVISICAVGPVGAISYGDMVKTGDDAAALSGKGWAGEAWFAAKEGDSKKGEGAYKYTDSNANATVLAYVDYHRQIKNPAGDGTINANKVYCIQVYSNTDSSGNAISFDDMTKPAKCSYDDNIVAELEKETAEFLIAYRVSCGFAASQYPLGQVVTLKSEEGLAAAAREYLNKCLPGSDTPPAGQSGTALKSAIIAQNQQQGQDATMHYAQITMAGCADSIGFANFIIDQKESVDYIIKLRYSSTTSPPYQYCYQYLGVAAAGESENYACMVIDLVDRWYDSDPDWRGNDDDDDDEGWE